MHVTNLNPPPQQTGDIPVSNVLATVATGNFNPDRFYVALDLNTAAPQQDSLYLWGCLVKSWATGVNHMPGKQPNDSVPPRPSTGAELATLLNSLGVAHNMPAGPVNVVYCQSDATTVAIRLPAKEAVLAKEKNFAAGGNYNLPQFYGVFYGAQAAPASWNSDVNMFIHTLRVGEYSMNNCA